MNGILSDSQNIGPHSLTLAIVNGHKEITRSVTRLQTAA